MLKKSFLVA